MSNCSQNEADLSQHNDNTINNDVDSTLPANVTTIKWHELCHKLKNANTRTMADRLIEDGVIPVSRLAYAGETNTDNKPRRGGITM